MTAPCEPTHRGAASDAAAEVAAWAASGAMWLTGPADAPPLGPPSGLVPKLRAIAAVVTERAATLGRGVDLDPLAVLGQRAAVAGLRRRGATSCGGATRLLPARDGWLAVSLARPSDIDLVPAWLEIDPPVDADGDSAPEEIDGADDRPGAGVGAGHAAWTTVAAHVAGAPVRAVVERAHMLGLPVAALPGAPPVPTIADPPLAPLPLRAIAVAGAAAPPLPSLAGLLVVDLSSLWAGPLAGALLAAAGADVVKVESTGRPDGARRGPPAFFDLLNADKRSVTLDLRSTGGVRLLQRLVAGADVVIEASRPRALEQLGIDAAGVLSRGRPRVWVSITGHGRTGPARDRVGFGDDAAVAGGLVCRQDGRPVFCADAIGDPTSGMVAAAAALDALAVGGRWLLDVAMSGVAAHLAGPTLPTGVPPPPAAQPRAAAPRRRAPAVGEHTRAVLRGLVG